MAKDRIYGLYSPHDTESAKEATWGLVDEGIILLERSCGLNYKEFCTCDYKTASWYVLR